MRLCEYPGFQSTVFAICTNTWFPRNDRIKCRMSVRKSSININNTLLQASFSRAANFQFRSRWSFQRYQRVPFNSVPVAGANRLLNRCRECSNVRNNRVLFSLELISVQSHSEPRCPAKRPRNYKDFPRGVSAYKPCPGIQHAC